MRARAAAALVLALFVSVASALPIGRAIPGARAADEYTLETAAAYDVRPDDRRIDVSVEATFTNTTPDPEGQFSVFDEVKLAVHDQATEVKATDGEGDLEVKVAVENEVNVATVSLREDLRFEAAVDFTLTYALPDTEDAHLRVRPSVVVFPAWSFGTAGTVSVSIPEGFEIRIDGDELTVDGERLVSGEIENPSQWLSLVTAVRDPEYTTLNAAVPLSGGTADVLVRSFADDEPWGERIVALLERAMPLLEEEIGLPYPRLGQLVLTESVPADTSGFAEAPPGGTEIHVAYDQPPFTVLHQLAHVWLSPTLVDARWIREGLATATAAGVAPDVEVEPPFDPAAVAAEQAGAAFPLDAWSANAGPAGEAFGYAASWAFMNDLEARVGGAVIDEVLARVAASIGPYQSAELEPQPSPETVTTPESPLTTRAFLDHLETVGEQDVTDLFRERVLTEADVALLDARASAREAFSALVQRASALGAPDPVRGAMTAWSFDDAAAQIEAAAAWLDERDVLLDEMGEVGLAAPDRLQQAYRAYGGGPEADAELEAERSVVEAYADTATEVNGPRSFLDRVGLLGGPDPAQQLAVANAHFTEGDLQGSLDSITEAQRVLSSAEGGGIVRLASAVILVIIVLAAAVLLFRRRSSYTPGP